MSWEVKKLSDCCASIADGDHQAPPKSDSGVPFVTISNINTSNQFDFTDTMFVRQEYYDRLDSKRKAQKGDVLYSVVGTFGIPVYMKETVPFVFQRHIAILRPNDTMLPQFLYYTMLSRDFYMMADAAALGAAQRTISLTALRNMKISVPPMDVQEKIVGVLSAYDTLIENNQKQIKLLEEAAQRLYKEWFVDLRFPGHETTPIVDGVPEGWAWGTLADIAVFRRGKTITKDQVKAGIIPVVAGGLEPAYYHDTPNTNVPVVTVSGSGANAGFTRMYHTKVWASDCSYIDAAVTKNTAWVYCFLKGNKASIDAMQKGAAQPHVYAKDINAMKALFPDDKLMEQFRVIADPMFTRIGKLDMQIKRLAEARDRLLPKLMSGEIEV